MPPGPPTLRTGHLGGQGGLGLLVNQRALNRGQQIQGLTPLQAQGVGGQDVPVQRAKHFGGPPTPQALWHPVFG